MIYALFRTLFASALSIFYRWTQTEGEIPAEGPLVIVGNHPNGLIDPVAVMRLTTRPVRFLAKAPIFKMPLLGALVRAMRCLPVYRKQDDPSQMGKNDETFKAAHAALQASEAICIFPEGKSHSNPALEPLKTGAARIALGAEAGRDFTLGVRIVPVGFVYRDKGHFGSEVAVAVGAPLGVADVRAAHQADPVAAAQALTERIDAALREVTVNLASWEDLPLVTAASELYRAERGEGADWRPFAAGLAALRARDPARLEAVRGRILGLAGILRDLALPATEIDAVRPIRAVRFTVLQALQLALGLIPALLGMLAYAVPYQVPRWVALATDPEEDLQASVKVGVGILLFPLWAAGLTYLGWRLAGGWGVLAAGPGLALCALFAMVFIERERRAWIELRAFFLLGGRGTLRQRLVARRRALVEELEALGREVGVLQAG